MSQLQKDFLKAKLSKLPHLPPLPAGADDDADEEVDEEEEARDSFPGVGEVGASSARPPRNGGMGPPTSRPPRQRKTRDYSPLSADGYFEQALELVIGPPSPASASVSAGLDSPTSSSAAPTFRVYYTPPLVPDDASDTASDDDDGSGPNRGTVFVLHHGAGYSGLSFACAAKEITQQSKGEVGVMSFDARGHGKTRLPPDSSSSESGAPDMSLSTLAGDLVSVLSTMYPNRSQCPDLVLIGHSMGGAVVAEAVGEVQRRVGNVVGLAVLDVVEGSAMDALQGMIGLVNSQPKGFDSLEEAIEWHIRTGTLRNLESARISVPPLLTHRDLSTEDAAKGEEARRQKEDEEEMEMLEGEDSRGDAPTRRFEWEWTADLAATEPYWTGWFSGLSSKFLAAKTARLLLLAGTDRLDRELTIAQMQGKYQLVVFPEVGHCLQEDAPDKTAETLLAFWRRNERLYVKGIKNLRKVGQM